MRTLALVFFFLILMAIALPGLAGWRVKKLPGSNLTIVAVYKKYLMWLLFGIAINNALTVWSWLDLPTAVHVSASYYAKRIIGLAIEDTALALLCLFLLGFSNGVLPKKPGVDLPPSI